MMFDYCQGTGCSLSSQYLLQESILKIQLGETRRSLAYYRVLTVFSYSNFVSYFTIRIEKYTMLQYWK